MDISFEHYINISHVYDCIKQCHQSLHMFLEHNETNMYSLINLFTKIRKHHSKCVLLCKHVKQIRNKSFCMFAYFQVILILKIVNKTLHTLCNYERQYICTDIYHEYKSFTESIQLNSLQYESIALELN